MRKIKMLMVAVIVFMIAILPGIVTDAFLSIPDTLVFR
ncbi:hypothetical protein T260_18050 [Geobacillus thermopakistaniensis]|uniref:Uncharacterized protein n=1 Tax=Geobacillus thermopakistaniensis (strain MAS1) TaxID=1408282 RepID=A0A7U9J856_GEOTM|nr:hypothetical protein T260_18050 [Geobacillus sp. MAS1]